MCMHTCVNCYGVVLLVVLMFLCILFWLGSHHCSFSPPTTTPSPCMLSQLFHELCCCITVIFHDIVLYSPNSVYTVGVLTVLLKGPWILTQSVDAAGEPKLL